MYKEVQLKSKLQHTGTYQLDYDCLSAYVVA